MEKRSFAVMVTRMLPQRQLPVIPLARSDGECCLGSPVKGGMVGWASLVVWFGGWLGGVEVMWWNQWGLRGLAQLIRLGAYDRDRMGSILLVPM